MVQTPLILEGGGMRGVYTAGVLDCFLDEGIRFGRVYAVSAGACHATSYLSGQRGRGVRTVVDYRENPRYAGVRSLLRTGDFFGVEMIYHEIPDRLLPFDYAAFAANPAELFAVATDCRTGEPAYLPVGDMRRDVECVRASSSLPLLSRMVEIGGVPYLDGGVADSIPLGRALADGAVAGVVVLTRHREYRKKPDPTLPLMRARYRRYPGLVRAMERRHEQYNASLELVERREARGEAFVIRPGGPVEIGRLEKDRDKLERLYQDGLDDARACVRQLREFLRVAQAI